MRLRLMLVVQLWACAALATEPGKEFSADITWPLYAQRIGQGDLLPVHVRVAGCDDARVAVQSRQATGDTFTPWQRRSADFTRTSDGTYATQVDVLQHLGDARRGCWASAEQPMNIELQIVATCGGENREAVSKSLPVLFAPADVTLPVFMTERYVVIDAHRVMTLGQNFIALHSTLPVQESSMRVNGMLTEMNAPRQSIGFSTPRHEILVVGDTAYVSDVCMFPRCHDITARDPATGVQLTAPVSTIYRINAQAHDSNIVTGMLEVPGTVVRMVSEADGSILALSENQSVVGGLGALSAVADFPSEPGWFLSRIAGDTVTTLEVTRGSRVLRTGGGAQGLAVMQTGDTYRLQNLHYPHESQILSFPSQGATNLGSLGGLGSLGTSNQLALSPDGSQWTVQRDDGLWLDDGRLPLKLLEPKNDEAILISTAWQDDVVVVSLYSMNSQDSAVRSKTFFFDRHTGARINEFISPWNNQDLDVVRVDAISGNRFAAIAGSSIAILDKRGNTMATNRVPGGCGNVVWLQQLPDGRLMWKSGDDNMQQLFSWDINPYRDAS